MLSPTLSGFGIVRAVAAIEAVIGILAAVAKPAAVGIHRAAFRLLIDPRLGRAIGFADVGANLISRVSRS